MYVKKWRDKQRDIAQTAEYSIQLEQNMLLRMLNNAYLAADRQSRTMLTNILIMLTVNDMCFSVHLHFFTFTNDCNVRHQPCYNYNYNRRSVCNSKMRGERRETKGDMRKRPCRTMWRERQCRTMWRERKKRAEIRSRGVPVRLSAYRQHTVHKYQPVLTIIKYL